MSTDLVQKLFGVISRHPNVRDNISRTDLIKDTVQNRQAMVAKCGALATWTPTCSNGRSPKDTYIVRRKASEEGIDWTSPNNLPIDEETFDMAYNDAIELLKSKEFIYISDRVVGADSNYALPVKTITYNALSSLFTDNMFRPVPSDIKNSIFSNRGFTLLAMPFDKLKAPKYLNRLQMISEKETSGMIVAIDVDRRLGLIVGSAYMGSMKKMLFTVMNYLLPFEGILPLHCSANEGKDGSSALLLGLSGTGKTTLSADPERALLGDDEHGWGENGIANFENGCYAKMIDINPDKEPEIYHAVNHHDDYLNHGVIIENAMIYPDGVFDYNDDRLTPNSRASYPLSYLSNIKPSSVSGHPKTILFLTADAYGVLPPIAKLDKDQAMLWFLMGYTSKLAGTETGIKTPQATFSRFFGQPFMPLKPEVYARMLGEKMEEHAASVYLVNTGWSGGAYGVGQRMDINHTRAMVTAAMSGELDHVEYLKDSLFHLNIPKSCPNVPPAILNPSECWSVKSEYQKSAKKLADIFAQSFDKTYGKQKLDKNIVNSCPGK